MDSPREGRHAENDAADREHRQGGWLGDVEFPVNDPATSVGDEIGPVKICGPAISRSDRVFCDTLKPPPPARLYPRKGAVNWRTVAPCVKVAIALLNVQVIGDSDTGDGEVGSRME